MIESVARLFVGATHRLGRSWLAALGLLAAGTGLLGAWLPRRARRQGATTRAGLLRQAGASYLGFALLDLLGQASQHPLRIAYPPLPSAWFTLLLGRAAISGGVEFLTLLPAFPVRARRPLRAALLLAHAGLTLLTAYACWGEASILRTRRIHLPVPGWVGRLRVVQISDLHIERLTRRDEAMLDRIRAAQPDLLVLTGDYISIDYRDAAGYAALRGILETLGAIPTRYGAYAIPGNVDAPDHTRTFFAGTGIRLLEEAVVRLDMAGHPVELLGVSCRHYGRTRHALAAFGTTLALAGPKAPGVLRILLHHMPDLAEHAAAAEIDLYLCGHTHGGQIRLPGLGALFTSSRYGRRYDRGLHRLPHGGAIYTTTGVGLEGLGLPRARLGSPPEIAILEIQGAGA